MFLGSLRSYCVAFLVPSLIWPASLHAQPLHINQTIPVSPAEDQDSYTQLLHPTSPEAKNYPLSVNTPNVAKNLVDQETVTRLLEDLHFVDETAEIIEKHLAIFKRVFLLHEKAVDYALAEIQRDGLEDFLAKANVEHAYFIDEGGLGKAEYRPIDGYWAIKIVDAETELAFLFFDGEQISRQSRHLSIYCDRINFFSGYSMADKKKAGKGRDLFVVQYKGDNLETIEFVSKPHIQSPEDLAPWAKKYWNAIYKSPTDYNYLFGSVSGALQVGVAGAVSGLALATGTTDHFSYAPLVLNGIFGTVIGIYSSTYVNWTKAGSELRRALKASVVSLMFAALIIPLTGANKLEGIDSLSLSVLVVAAAIGANILGNNFAKVAFQEWALIKERKRTDTGNWTLKMPFPKLELHRARPGGGGQPRLSIVIEWLEYETAFRKRDINFQWTSGLPVNFLKNADLVGVPLGTFTLWASIPFVKAMTILWAKKKYPDDEELHTRMKESWDETWGHYFDVIAHPAQYGDLLGRLTNKAWKFHQQSAAEKLLTFEESLIQFSSDFIRSSQNAMSSIKRSCESRILGITAAVGALF